MPYKKTYYVAVGTGEIAEDNQNANFEFTIEATPEEVIQLQQLFDSKDSDDLAAFARAHIPFMPYHKDQPNDDYDQHLREIYQFIYDHGTPETKQQMDEMGILDWDPSF